MIYFNHMKKGSLQQSFPSQSFLSAASLNRTAPLRTESVLEINIAKHAHGAHVHLHDMHGVNAAFSHGALLFYNSELV